VLSFVWGEKIKLLSALKKKGEWRMEQKPKTYDWASKDGKINCFSSQSSTCTVSGLWQANELTSFHDAELAQATKEINAILSKIEKGNKDPQRELSFIQFKKRHFLVWTRSGIIGPDDDDKTILKTLGLKAR
jgi:hypothetical protein